MKRISLYAICRVKRLDRKAFDAMDVDSLGYGDIGTIGACNRWKRHWLAKEGLSDEEMDEAESLIRWENEDCSSALRNRGWEVVDKPPAAGTEESK